MVFFSSKIDRASAGALRRSKAEKSADQEEEDEFGYTKSKCSMKHLFKDLLILPVWHISVMYL